MKSLLALVFSVTCLLSPVRSAEPADLAPGLRYLRIHSLEKSAAELARALSPNRTTALVLDLRYVADEQDAAEAINALNHQPAKPALYVLVSPETPKDVAAVIQRTSTPLVTLGIRDSHPKPEVEVTQSVADDRAAYQALENGTSLAALISGKIDKDHFDEAELVKEFKNGNSEARPPLGSAAASPAPTTLTDRVLQRAVHLHLALQALKR
jgi:hypothetical protein